ncbi:MAG TPA: serine hydrolase [Chloroflexia bacterium]|nr:serine hydrolase [Chloroflexia bacterium]
MRSFSPSWRRLAAGLLGVCMALVLFGTPLRGSIHAQSETPTPMLYGSAPDVPDSQLQAIIEEVVGDLPGTWGIAVKKLDTGQYAAYNGDEQQVSASLYKMWVLSELYRQAKAGDIELDGYASVTGEDAYYDSLLGDLRVAPGNSITLRRAAYMMVTVSDNTTSHLLVRTLGPDNINRFMRQNGFTHSYLDWSGVGDNLTTPLDVLREMEMIATSKMVDAEASQQMVELMLDQQINNLLPPGLPDEARFAHKTGSLESLLHDAGIVYGPSGPFVIVAMSSDLYNYASAWDNMPILARRVYDYFNDRPSSPALYFPQTRQTVGHDFLKFWHDQGGVEKFGYPIGPEHMRGGILTQQFERARFEWHPENANAGGAHPQVTLGLVGQERAAQLGHAWQREPDAGRGRYFPETGQNISGEIYEYWLNNGGERLFGYPISPAAEMINPTDSKSYTMQWFQRARMEIHPELPEGKRVVLGALVSEMQGNR